MVLIIGDYLKLMKNLKISIDDYSRENIRIAELLKDLEKYTTFYIELIPHKCFVNKGSAEIQIKELSKLGFEIGCHTIRHIPLTDLDLEEAKKEIREAKERIEFITNKQCLKISYPKDYTNREIDNYAKELGFVDIRHRKDITCHVYPHPEYKMNWLAYLVKQTKENHTIHFQAHGWEITKFGNWEKFNNAIFILKEWII